MLWLLNDLVLPVFGRIWVVAVAVAIPDHAVPPVNDDFNGFSLGLLNAPPIHSHPLLTVQAASDTGQNISIGPTGGYAKARWRPAVSYAITLWAMTWAPVASVAALRETSVLFAAPLGTSLLKERFGRQRAAGTPGIVCGVVALRLA